MNDRARRTTGNEPPWKLPARARYLGIYEASRAKIQFKRPGIRQPKDLMAVGMTILVRSPFFLFFFLHPPPPGLPISQLTF